MSRISDRINELTNILPVKEQRIIYEIVRRFVVAWDPDYVKLTPEEEREYEEALKEPITITHEELKKELGLEEEKLCIDECDAIFTFSILKDDEQKWIYNLMHRLIEVTDEEQAEIERDLVEDEDE